MPASFMPSLFFATQRQYQDVGRNHTQQHGLADCMDSLISALVFLATYTKSQIHIQGDTYTNINDTSAPQSKTALC